MFYFRLICAVVVLGCAILWFADSENPLAEPRLAVAAAAVVVLEIIVETVIHASHKGSAPSRKTKSNNGLQEKNDESEADKVRDYIRNYFFDRMGDMARLSFFLKSTDEQSPHNGHYFNVVKSLRDNPRWSIYVVAIDEWVNIGYTTLKESGRVVGQSTKFMLYAAAIKNEMRGAAACFPLKDPEAFAREVMGQVSANTLASH